MFDSIRGMTKCSTKPQHRASRGDRGNALLVVMAAAAILFVTAAAVIGVVVFQQAQQERAQAVTRATGLAQQGMEVYLTALRIDPNYRTRVPLIAGVGEDGTWTVAANVASGTITSVGHDTRSGLFHVIRATVTDESFSGYTIVSGSALSLGKSTGSGIDIRGSIRGNNTITLNQTFSSLAKLEYASGTVVNPGGTPTLRVSRVDFSKAGSTFPNMYTAATSREPWVTGASGADVTKPSLIKPLAFYRDPSNPARNYWAGTAASTQPAPKGSQADLAGVGIDFGTGSPAWMNRTTGLFYVREVTPPTINAAAKAAANAPTRQQYIDLASTDPVWNITQGGVDNQNRTEVTPRGLNPNGNNVIYVGGDYDVYVKGEYSRSVTIVSERNIYIIGSVTRAASATTATLGLVAKGDIIICGGMPAGSETATYTAAGGDLNSYSGRVFTRGAQGNSTAYAETMPNNVTIQAAMLSVNGAIVMAPEDLTSAMNPPAKRSGLLHIVGSLAAAGGLRGPNFVNQPDPLYGGFENVLVEYDDQLQETPPPLFPELGAGTLKIKRWDEFDSAIDPNAGLSFPTPTDYRPHGSVPVGSQDTTVTSLEPDDGKPVTVSNASQFQHFFEEAIITLTAVDPGAGIAETWHRVVGKDSGRQSGSTIELTELRPNTATTYTVEFGSIGLDAEEETTKSVTVRVVGPDTLLPTTTVVDDLNPSFELKDGYPQPEDPDYVVYGNFYPVFTAIDTTEGTGAYEIIVVQKNDPQHVLGVTEADPEPIASDPNPDLTKPLRYAPEGVRPPDVGFITRQFSYYAIDASGNREFPSKTFTIKQHAPDVTPPITFCDVQPLYIGPATIHLNGIDDVEGQGLLDTWYSLDNGATWTTSTINPTTVTVPAPRYGQDPVEHTLMFYSRDRATQGAVLQPNVEEAQSVSFIVAPALPNDFTAPTTTSDAKPSYIGPVVISLTATDTGGVAAIYYQLDDGPIVAGTRIEVQDPWTGTAPHHIDFWSVDWANNVEVPKTANFTITPEQVAPVTSAHNLDLYSGPAVFQLTAEDNQGGSGLAGTYFKIDDGPVQLGAGMPGLTWVTVTGEGTHTVSFYSMDHAQNQEATKTCSFLIDTVAPVTTDNNVGNYVGQAIIRLTATDGGSGVKVTQWRSAADGLVHDSTTVPLGGGSWDIMYWSIDNAGNVESPLKTMHVDVATSPDVTYPDSYDEITDYYKAPGPAGLRLFSWDVQSGVQTMYYKVDSGTTETIEGKENPPAYYAPLVSVDGTHTIQYRAIDASGNIEPHWHSRTFMLDTALPVTTTNARAGATYWSNQMFNLAATDVGSGIKGTYYSLDGALPVKYSTGIWVPAPTDGYSRPHVIRYWSVDVAGNAEVVKSKSFTSKPTDAIAPSTFVVNSTITTECITLVLRATDNPGGSAVQHIYYRIDTGAIVQGVLDNSSALNTPKQTMFKVVGAGSHTVEYWAVDYAGNIEIFKTYVANVDVEAPKTGSDIRALYSTPATITLTAADNTGGTGVAATLYRIDGGSVATGTAPITTIVVPAPASGTVQHTLEFWSTDVAGNVETPHQMASFKIDVTPPTTTSNAVKTYSGPATLVLNATDDPGGSGVQSTYYKLDGGTKTTAVGPSFVVPAPTGGSKPHTLEFWSTDKAENTEKANIATFTVTAVANMTFSELFPVEGGTVGMRNPNVSIKATSAAQAIVGAVAMIDGVQMPVTLTNPAGYWTQGTTTEWVPDPSCDGCPDDWDCFRWIEVTTGTQSVWVPANPLVATAVFPTAGLANGPHVAQVTFLDAQDASKTKTWTFYVNASPDVTPPVTSSDAQAYYKAPATITLTASDEVGGMGLANIYYRLDGVQSTGTIPSTSVNVATAGKHTLEFWATDRASNKETTKTVTFVVDWVAPTTTIGYTGSTAGTATVFLSASDNVGGSGLKSTNYKLDGGATLSPIAGANTVAQFHFDDGTGASVGDASTANTPGTMVVGTTGTQTSVDQAWSNGANGRFGKSLNFDGVNDYVDLGVSRAPLNTLSGTFSIAAWVKTTSNSGQRVIASRGNDWRLQKVDGNYVFEHRNDGSVIVYPSAANSSTDWVYVVGTFDATAHKASLYINGALVASKDQAGTTRIGQAQNQIGNSYAWHAGGTYNDYFWSGQIDEVVYSSNARSAGDIQSYYSAATASNVPPLQFSVDPPASGPAIGHTVQYWSVDNAGNVETAKSASFQVSRPVDTIPPTTTSNAVASYFRPAPIVLTAVDNPGGWGVAATYSKLDGGPAVTGTSPSTGLAGAHTLQFWSVDAAGNIETTKSVSYTVLADTTPPVTTHNALSSYVGTATVTLTATDPGNGWGVSGVYYMGPANTYYTVDDGPMRTGTVITVAPPMGDAVTHHIDFHSVDAAGNVEATKTTGPFAVEGVPAYIVWSNHTPAKLIAVKNSGPAVSVTGQALKAIVTAQAKIDGVSYTVQPLSWLVPDSSKATATILTSGLASGPHAVEITFRLVDGSRATEKWSFTTDVIAPVTTSNALAAYVGTATVALTATDNSGGSGLRNTFYKIDDVGTRTTSGVAAPFYTAGSYNTAANWGGEDGIGDAVLDIYTSTNGSTWNYRTSINGAALGPWGNLQTGTGSWACPGYTDTYVRIDFRGNWYWWDSDYEEGGVESSIYVTAQSGKLGALSPATWTFTMKDPWAGGFSSIGVTGVAYSDTSTNGALYTVGTPLKVYAPVWGSATHHIDFWSEDAVGNVESEKTANFTVSALPDTIAPTSRAVVATFYPTPTTISVTATDNAGGWGVSKLSYVLDGGTTQTVDATLTGNVPLVAQLPTGPGGSHTLKFWATDRATTPNVESPIHVVTYSVASDTTPPNTVSDAKATYIGPATISLTASDNVGGWGLAPGATAYKLDGGVTTSGTVITVPDQIAGTVAHKLEFWSVDRANNKEITKTANFTIAAVQESMTFSVMQPIGFIKATNPTVILTGQSTLPVNQPNGVAVSLDGATVSNPTITYPTITSNNPIWVGGTSVWVAEIQWYDECYDCQECDSGIESWGYWTAGGYWQDNFATVTDYTKPTVTFPTSGLSVGQHSVTVTFTVTSGRQAIKTWTFTVDTIAPTTTSNAIANYTGVAPITLTANDNVGGAGVKTTYYKWDNAATWTTYTSTVSMAAPTSGSATHTISFYSDDLAQPTPGNAEAAKTATFCVSAQADTTPPWGNGVTGGGGSYSTPTTFTLGGGDSGWGVRYICYILDGGPTITTQALSVQVGSGAEGRHTLEWWVIDWAGNSSPHYNVWWIVDTQAPTTTSNVLSNYAGNAVITLNAIDTPKPPATVSSGVSYSQSWIDGVAQPNGQTITVAAPASGSPVSHTITYRSVDVAGNIESVKGPFTFTVAPAIAPVVWTGQNPVANSSITIRTPVVSVTGQAIGSIVGAYTWLDGNQVTPAQAWVISPSKLTVSFNTSNLTDGLHTVLVRYVVSGQGQADTSWTFTVAAPENQAPVTTDNRLSSYVGAATISLNAVDYPLVGASGIKVTNYTIDGVAKTGTSIVVAPPVYGGPVSHTLSYYSQDNNLNTEVVRGPYTFTVAPATDVTPPTTNSNATSTYVGAATVTLSAVDTGTGVAATYYQYDDVVTQYSGTSISLTPPSWGSESRHIHFWSVDRTLPTPNTEVKKTAYFTISALPDGTPPVTSHNAGSWYGSTTSLITLSATDSGWGVKQIQYVQDGGATQTVLAASTSIAVGAEGAHSLKFWAVDRADVSEIPRTVFYHVDMTAPITTSNALSAYIGSASISLSATDPVGGSGVQYTYYKVDGSTNTYQYLGTPISVPGPVSGLPASHSVTFWSVDFVGKTEAAKTATFTISLPGDATPPTTTSNTQPFYPGVSTITLTAVDNTGGWGIDKTYYSVDDSAFAVGTAVSTLGSGAHHIDFYSTDLAGNRETTKTASYNVDMTPPTTTSNTVASYTGAASITLTPLDNTGGSGIKSTTYTIDDGAPMSGTAISVPAPQWDSKAHHIDFYSTDNMNNVETSKRADFTINALADTTPPTTTSNAAATYSSPATITLTTTENTGGWGISTINYSLDGSPTVVGFSTSTGGVMTATCQVGTGKGGSHVLKFWAVDRAGKVEPTKTANYSVAYDTTPPVTTSNASAYNIGSTVVKLTATDAGWGVANTYYRIDGGATQTIAGGANQTAVPSFIAPIVGSDTHTLQFWSSDRANNLESVSSVTFVVDSVPANVTINVLTPAEGSVLTTSGMPISAKAKSEDGKTITAVTMTLDGIAKTPTNVINTINATSTFNASGLNNSEHTVVYTVTVAGGAQKSKSWKFTVEVNNDFTPPTTLSDAQTSYFGNAVVTLTPTDNPGGKGVKATYYTIDGGATTTGTVINIAGPTSGEPVSHTITYWSTDKAVPTNTEVANVKTFLVGLKDTTPPTTTSDALAAYHSPATIRLTASDNVGGSGVAHTYYILDRGAQVEGTLLGTGGEGPHTLEFWSVDKSGNIETSTKVSFKVDLTAPVTTSDAVPDYTGMATIRLSATDEAGGSGVKYTYYKIDGGQQVSGITASVAPPTYASAQHVLEFWSVDTAGNVEATKTANFTVNAVPDSTPPTTVSDAKSSYPVPGLITLTVTDNDGGWGVDKTFYKLDGGAQTQTLSMAIRTGSAGDHTLEFWSVDKAGKIETPHKSVSYHVVAADTTAPHTTANVTQGQAFIGSAQISLVATDNSGAPCITYYRLDTGADTTGTALTVPAPGAGSASHTLYFWSVDINGLTESVNSVGFTVDALPANLIFSGLYPAAGGSVAVRNPMISITATSSTRNIASVVIQVDGVTKPSTLTTGTKAATATCQAAGLANLVHTVSATFTDVSGATSVRTWTFTVAGAPDTTAPFTANDGVAYYRTNATIRLTATDEEGGTGVAATYYKIDGGSQLGGALSGSMTTVIQVTVAGPHTIEYWSVDAAGNAELVADGPNSQNSHRLLRLNVDKIGPTTTSNAGESYTGVANITLTPTDNSNGSGIAATYYAVDNGERQTGKSVSVPAPANGSVLRTLYFWSVDNAGNVEATKSVEFAQYAPGDATPPTTTSNAVAVYPVQGIITLTAVDNAGGWGVAHTYYNLDSTGDHEGTLVGTGGAGTHTLKFWSVDVAGLVEAQNSVTYTVTANDTVAPTTTSNAVATYTGTGQIQLTAADNTGGSGVAHTYYTWDDGTRIESTLIGVAGAGSHHIDFWSVDVAGNSEATKTASFTVVAPDFTPPTTTSSALSSYVGTATIVLTPTDNVGGVGVWTTFYRVDGGVKTEGRTVTVAPPVAGSATHEIRFWSIDLNGNTEGEKVVSFTVAPVPDTVAPTTTHNGVASYTGTATITLTPTDNAGGQGVNRTIYTINDGPEQTGLVVTKLAPATGSALNHIDFWSIDNAGNREVTRTFNFTSNAVVVAQSTATLTFWWTGTGYSNMQVLNSHGVQIAQRSTGWANGADLCWTVTVPSGDSYTMDAYDWYDDDSGSNGSSTHITGIMAPGSSYTFSY